MTWFLGIDGGGTHTRALIAHASGAVLGMGVAGSSNYPSVGLARAVAALGEAIAAARGEARVAGEAEGAFLGLAGVKTAADHLAWREPLAGLNLVKPKSPAALGLDHDLRIALAGGCGDSPGIVVVAGTGSAGYGRDLSGHSAQVGGWGWLLDDQGGGVWLAGQGLRRVMEAADGRASATRLEPALFAELGVTTAREAMQWAMRPDTSPSQLAALASVVVDASVDDDAARGIVWEGARQLARLVDAILSQLDFGAGDVAIVPAGGLLGNPAYREPVRDEIAKIAPCAQLMNSSAPALVGAVVLAAQTAGTPLTREAVARLAAEVRSRRQIV